MMLSERQLALAALGCVATYTLLTAGAVRAAEDKFFDSDGVKIRYIDQGKGEPVLLVHGFAGSLHLQWGAPGVLNALAEDYRVIAYDHRGHGRSGKPHDADCYGHEMVEDALRLLDHLHIQKAHIVGYSMGAFITDKLLMEHPERFLTATLAGGGWAKANDQRAEFITDVVASLEQGDGIGPLLVRLTPEGRPKPTESQLRLANKVFGLVNDQTALACVMRGMKQLAVTEEQLKANRVPTLAIIGELDPLKVTVDEMAAVMPNLEVTVIDGASHVQAFRRPEFARILKTFLSQHSTP
jgi:pimeloyl-ACP methyl ester carboxylesterase